MLHKREPWQINWQQTCLIFVCTCTYKINTINTHTKNLNGAFELPHILWHMQNIASEHDFSQCVQTYSVLKQIWPAQPSHPGTSSESSRFDKLLLWRCRIIRGCVSLGDHIFYISLSVYDHSRPPQLLVARLSLGNGLAGSQHLVGLEVIVPLQLRGVEDLLLGFLLLLQFRPGGSVLPLQPAGPRQVFLPQALLWGTQVDGNLERPHSLCGDRGEIRVSKRKLSSQKMNVQVRTSL